MKRNLTGDIFLRPFPWVPARLNLTLIFSHPQNTYIETGYKSGLTALCYSNGNRCGELDHRWIIRWSLDATVTENIITSHLDNFPPFTEGSHLETRRNWIPNVSRNFSLDDYWGHDISRRNHGSISRCSSCSSEVLKFFTATTDNAAALATSPR